MCKSKTSSVLMGTAAVLSIIASGVVVGILALALAG